MGAPVREELQSLSCIESNITFSVLGIIEIFWNMRLCVHLGLYIGRSN